jgi:hypothetical protein
MMDKSDLRCQKSPSWALWGEGREWNRTLEEVCLGAGHAQVPDLGSRLHPGVPFSV